jgi:hypothetical protein
MQYKMGGGLDSTHLSIGEWKYNNPVQDCRMQWNTATQCSNIQCKTVYGFGNTNVECRIAEYWLGNCVQKVAERSFCNVRQELQKRTLQSAARSSMKDK